jgi:hypothetical protein
VARFRESRNIYGVLVGKHLENLVDVNGRIILKRNLKKWVNVAGFIGDQDRDNWRALVIMVLNLPVP